MSRAIVIKSDQVFVFFPSHTCSYQEDAKRVSNEKRLHFWNFSVSSSRLRDFQEFEIIREKRSTGQRKDETQVVLELQKELDKAGPWEAETVVVVTLSCSM